MEIGKPLEDNSTMNRKNELTNKIYENIWRPVWDETWDNTQYSIWSQVDQIIWIPNRNNDTNLRLR